MTAGFEVRNHSAFIRSDRPEAMFTIQVLADPGWAEIDLDAAQAALTAAYASAFAELSQRVEAAQNQPTNWREAPNPHD